MNDLDSLVYVYECVIILIKTLSEWEYGETYIM